MIRYYLFIKQTDKKSSNDHWAKRIGEILENMKQSIIYKECFKNEIDLKDMYAMVEISL
jgi:hypothetical protein